MSSKENSKIEDTNHSKVNTTTDINEDDCAGLSQFTPLRSGGTMLNSQQIQTVKPL